MSRDFPDDFVWGAVSFPAGSEGETVSDWARYAAPDGSVPDDGPRHWRRYRFDFRTMAGIGIRAYRFGCDWARLQRGPYTPLIREDTLRYLEMMAELRSLGIEPWLVLFQHALPRWAAAAGGWLNPETPHWFADFAARLADATDGEVRYWIPLHAPQIYALASFAWGTFPGQKQWGRLDLAAKAFARLRTGHRLAAAAIRRRLPEAQVGLSLSGGGFNPGRAWHPGDWLTAAAAEWFCNRAGSRGLLRREPGCDFLMLGTGNELPVRAGGTLSLSHGLAATLPGRMRHEGGGDSNARRRRRVRRWRRRAGVPVYLVGSVPEDDAEGLHRLLAAYAGMDGVGPAGFFYDSLLDQFDPDKGLADRRGLIRVDFHGGDRRRDPRRLAREYGTIIATGRVDGGAVGPRAVSRPHGRTTRPAGGGPAGG
ncbi:MAG: family 1 glycosylhydrolase [Planctomycetes bacterium]|nr:family 1 glycosylhydrolase [Planctomycetota bacterium]